jgi:hypothetical protein
MSNDQRVTTYIPVANNPFKKNGIIPISPESSLFFFAVNPSLAGGRNVCIRDAKTSGFTGQAH